MVLAIKSKKRLFSLLVIAGFSVVACGLLAADGYDESLNLQLETVVVTGTRTAQLQVEAPVRVELLSRADIERQHAQDLSEAVESIPGLALKPIIGKEGLEAWMQGVSANRILVLIDGEPVSASTGSSVDLTQIATGNIERIEVVKGATSVLYGSAAMGGVINVITREPEEGNHYQLSVDAGSHGDKNISGESTDVSKIRTNINVQHKSEKWFVAGAINARIQEGWAENFQAWDQQGADGHKINAMASLRYYQNEDDYYQLRYEMYDQQQHTQFTDSRANNIIRHHKHDDAEREHLTAKAYWRQKKGDLSVSAYHEGYINRSQPKTDIDRYAEFNSKNIESQWNYEIGQTQVITLGAKYFEESLNQYKQEVGVTKLHELQGGDEVSRSNEEIYFQHDAEFSALRLLPGIRYQNDSNFGSKWTPKINFRWDLFDEEGTVFIRGGVGKGYRVPNLKERYYIFDHSHLGYIVNGNPNLAPESSTSYQFGMVWTDRDAYQWDINFFRNNLKDLIETDYSHAEGAVQVFQYANIEEAFTQGLELNAAYHLGGSFRVKMGYVYLDAKNKKTKQRLKDRFQHQLKAVVDYNTRFGLDISVMASWQDQEIDDERALESPSWHSLDIKLNQVVNDRFSVYAGLNNLTNTQKDFYAPYDRRPEEGRYIYLGFKLNQ